ncbi:hypothetical protein CKAH01_18879 [Colletotrichum kahawae]|uniref:Uncharacterized protein n=2 Tax=Colletotrichum kahawae TaxID=34407 RepID=A0AAD9Y3R1_COLKA|nr:hypothetical protein CKAH01_08235 [Colletotrichum kahawae]KAK2736791.1 hypothetical protein CKAH01_18879 [Colletotrichum kahawae]
MAARAQPPLRQTSRRVCGVEGRRLQLYTLQYTPLPSVLQLLPKGHYVFYPSLVPTGALVPL